MINYSGPQRTGNEERKDLASDNLTHYLLQQNFVLTRGTRKVYAERNIEEEDYESEESEVEAEAAVESGEAEEAE